MIGYKFVQRKDWNLQVHDSCDKKDFAILKIEILGEVIEPMSGRGKLRTNDIRVLSAENLHRKPIKQTTFYSLAGHSLSYSGFKKVYTVGNRYMVDNLNTNLFETCGSGIHFFRNKVDCVDWLFTREWIRSY